jgi:nucleoside-diphosphate-sugar epimerase
MERAVSHSNSETRVGIMKKILVTGATGFIGNHLVPKLIEEGYSVIASSANKEKASAFNWFSKVEYVHFNMQDVSESINYFDFFNQPDIVVHLAWEGLPNYKSLFHFEENLPRHYRFLKNLVKNGAKDITITGTCFEYGMKDGCLQEDMITNPANPYGLAKDCLRKFLEQLQAESPFVLKWVRLFYMFGKGQNPNSIFSQLEAAIQKGEKVFNMSGGEQQRDYLPVTDVASAIAAIAVQDEITGIINCCSGKPVKIRDMVEEYLSSKKIHMDLNLGFYPYSDYEPMSFWGDNNKMNTILRRSS